MPTWTIKGGAQASGRNLSWDNSVSANAEQWFQPALTAGQTAASWAKSTASAGSAVMAAGHGLLTGNFDVYWTGGKRYGVPGTVSGNTVSLSGGSGDDFPDTDTTVILCQPVAVTMAFDGDDLSAIVGAATYRSLVCLTDDEAAVHTFEILATAGLSWNENDAAANPLAGKTIVSATMSTTDPTEESPITFGILYDSTPTYPG